MAHHLKICGINDPAHIPPLTEGGSDMIGLVFFDKSPRNVSLKQAQNVARAAKHLHIVGLFVDPSDALLKEVLDNVPLTHIQLHGSESKKRCAEIKHKFGLPIIKAFGIANVHDHRFADTYADVADLAIFDAKPPNDAAHPGGLGHVFNWSILNNVTGHIPWLLSGGLNPENIEEAIRGVKDLRGFAGIDVSSGVEISKGVKDPERIIRFLLAAQNALK